jgi:DNA-directed RNA polymerase subunit RPC12/RpoP
MDSVRKGLRAGALEKDNYDRLVCAECGESLGTESAPEEVYDVRRCPVCGSEWKQL